MTAAGARRARAAALLVALWTLFGLARVASVHATARAFGSTPPPVEIGWGWPLLDAWTWALLTPLAALVVRRAPLERGRFRVPVLVWLAAGPALSALHAALLGAAYARAWPPGSGAYALPRPPFVAVVFLAWGLAGALYARDEDRRSREAALRSAGLEEEAARERLDAVRLRLDPDELLARLEALVPVMRVSPERAEEDLLALADALRSRYVEVPAALRPEASGNGPDGRGGER